MEKCGIILLHENRLENRLSKRVGQDSGSVLVGSVKVLIQINFENRRQNRLQNRPKPVTLTAPNEGLPKISPSFPSAVGVNFILKIFYTPNAKEAVWYKGCLTFIGWKGMEKRKSYGDNTEGDARKEIGDVVKRMDNLSSAAIAWPPPGLRCHLINAAPDSSDKITPERVVPPYGDKENGAETPTFNIGGAVDGMRGSGSQYKCLTKHIANKLNRRRRRRRMYYCSGPIRKQAGSVPTYNTSVLCIIYRPLQRLENQDEQRCVRLRCREHSTSAHAQVTIPECSGALRSAFS
ncbi:hypothetical protein C8J57DRAFT_1471894 [Mycena rebaudengoi]|nr:hypothetical protein C8J57DRAFT_1471894 [Mycena rebaudengoi]